MDQTVGMDEREELISPRNASLATGKIEQPITELVETHRARFGSENAKSCLVRDKFDVPIWHLNGGAEHVVGITNLKLWLEIHILMSRALKGI